jgi:hypothetical protein
LTLVYARKAPHCTELPLMLVPRVVPQHWCSVRRIRSLNVAARYLRPGGGEAVSVGSPARPRSRPTLDPYAGSLAMTVRPTFSSSRIEGVECSHGDAVTAWLLAPRASTDAATTVTPQRRRPRLDARNDQLCVPERMIADLTAHGHGFSRLRRFTLIGLPVASTGPSSFTVTV